MIEFESDQGKGMSVMVGVMMCSRWKMSGRFRRWGLGCGVLEAGKGADRGAAQTLITRIRCRAATLTCGADAVGIILRVHDDTKDIHSGLSR